MARPYTGKNTVGESRVTQKNGVIYVYERTSKYDRETKTTITTGRRLKGKILPGTTEIVPTRPKKKRSVSKDGENSAPNSETKASYARVGMTQILNWIGQESGITAALRKCFGDADARKIETIVQYWIGTGGQTLPRMEAWQINHITPYAEGMSEDVCSQLFVDIAANEKAIQNYFISRGKNVGTDRLVLAFDSTTVDTYSDQQIQARFGFSKESNTLPSVKLLTLMTLDDEQPFAFAVQPGNIPDVASIRNAIAQLKCVCPVKPLIVTDSGFCSEANLVQFTRNSMDYLTRISVDVTWVKEELDKIKSNITDIENACPFDELTCCKTVRVRHEFEITRERTRGKFKKGDTETFSRWLHLHFMYSETKALDERRSFRNQLNSLKKLVEQDEELTGAGKRKAKKYLIIEGEGASRTVRFNNEAVREEELRFGYFVLVSNCEKDPFKALELYRSREKIEDLFSVQKNSMDGRRPRVWYPENLRGRQFVQFVALGYYFFLNHRIRLLKETLGENDGSKTKEVLKREKALKTWLESRSLIQILEWFDAVTETRIQTPFARRRVTTETTARDDLFLQKLGVITA